MPMTEEDREIAALALVKQIARLNMTGDTIEDDDETYRFEQGDNADDAAETLDRLIKDARAICPPPRAKVTITMEGGCVQHLDAPDDVEVVIVDRDEERR